MALAMRGSSDAGQSTPELTALDSENLCIRCEKIPFQYLGSHPRNSSVFGDGNDWYATTFKMAEVRESAKTCRFCNRLLHHAPKELKEQSTIYVRFETLLIPRDRDYLNVVRDVRSLNVTYYGLDKDISLALNIPGVSFQRLPERNDARSADLNPSSGRWSPTQYQFNGRWRGPMLDFDLARAWKHACLKSHNHGPVFTNIAPPTWIRLVDVNRRCVVELSNLDSSTTWIALSYVWGTGLQLRFEKGSRDGLMRPGALQEANVPSTVYDAMMVTQQLGNQYLWVDALCVLQDDENDKTYFLPQMATIYARAELTIVDSASHGSHGGLPGVSRNISRQPQESFRIRGVNIARKLVPYTEYGLGSFNAHGPWASRGWTLQEGLMSSRCLIFSPVQVYWQCEGWTWLEDAFFETNSSVREDLGVLYDMYVFKSDLSSGSVDTMLNGYQFLVWMISERSFSFEEDILDSIAGLLHAITAQTGCEFIWGLPSGYLSYWLGWGRVHHRPGLQRRRKLCRVAISDSAPSALCQFPSWSWAGWIGSTFSAGGGKCGAGIEYFRIGPSGHPRLIPQVNQVSNWRLNSQDYPAPNYLKTQILKSDIPVAALQRGLQHRLLCFWTSTSSINLTAEIPKQATPSELDKLSFTIAAIEDSNPDCIWYTCPGALPLKILELRREKLTIHGLIVEIDEDGICFSMGICSFRVQAAIQLRSLTWEKVFLA